MRERDGGERWGRPRVLQRSAWRTEGQRLQLGLTIFALRDVWSLQAIVVCLKGHLMAGVSQPLETARPLTSRVAGKVSLHILVEDLLLGYKE